MWGLSRDGVQSCDPPPSHADQIPSHPLRGNRSGPSWLLIRPLRLPLCPWSGCSLRRTLWGPCCPTWPARVLSRWASPGRVCKSGPSPLTPPRPAEGVTRIVCRWTNTPRQPLCVAPLRAGERRMGSGLGDPSFVGEAFSGGGPPLQSFEGCVGVLWGMQPSSLPLISAAPPHPWEGVRLKACPEWEQTSWSCTTWGPQQAPPRDPQMGAPSLTPPLRHGIGNISAVICGKRAWSPPWLPGEA